MYVWLCNHDRDESARIDAFDVVYNILLKKVPKPPRVLKSGALSKAKSQLTTPWLYRKAIEENDLDPADYEEFVASLDPHAFNVRHRVHVTPERIEWWERFLIDLMNEMKDPLITPVDAVWRCAYCGYRSLCEAKYGEIDRDLLGARIAQDYCLRREHEEEEE
jgi:hypothetical protein